VENISNKQKVLCPYEVLTGLKKDTMQVKEEIGYGI
jgi:hypothetical protein